MIHFICGRAGSGKSEHIARALHTAAQAIPDPMAAGAKRLYLIVPEQQAVVWESRAARLLSPGASLSLEIVSFTRLANLVARTYGGLSDRAITRGGKAALMWSTLKSLRDSLTVFGGNVRAERVVPSLLSAVSEMKRAGVTPAMLAEASVRLSEDEASLPLSRRAEELSLICAAYQQILSERYTDDEDELAHLADRLKEHDFFAGADVFVDSFFSLTPVEGEIMVHIFRQAENVHVSFACPSRSTGENHFASAHEYLASMCRAADRAGREYSLTDLGENRRASAPSLRYLEENLWRFDASPYTGEDAPEHMRLIYARDRYGEAEAALCRIRELVESGARYSQIALIARDASKLRGILDTVLREAGIPCFFSECTDVPGRPAARLLLSALAVAGGGWRREDVILCAKTGLCGLTDDESDALELYTDTWHIRGRRAFETPWNMNPDGYVAEMSERGKRVLAAAESAREKLQVPLSRFCDCFVGGTASIPAICRAAYELLCELSVWDALQHSSDRLAAAGRSREAAEEAQLWDILMDSLDTLAEALPDAHADASAFAALLHQVLGTVRVGAIPGGIDEVVIGAADQVRLGEVRHVILLGAVDGEFPGTPSEDGFFSDTDKIRLEGEGIVLSATTDQRMKEELFWFYRAAALAHDTLSVLIPQSEGGTPLSPSLAAQRIWTLFPGVQTEDSAAWDARRTVWTAEDAAVRARILRGTAEGEALRELGVLPDRRAAQIPLSGRDEAVPEEVARQLFPKNISLTQSRLDSFVLCRFGYYCKYILKLEEPREASLSALNVGTFLHRIFELFFCEAKDDFPLSEERMGEICERVLWQVVEEITPPGQKSGRAQYLFARLRRCVLPMLRSLNREFAQSRFRPVGFEVKIGDGEGAEIPSLRIPAGDHNIRLRGTVDRLDVWQDGENTYVRVVDYKSGSKKFAPEDLAVGVNMQLMLYLFTVLHCPPGEFRRTLSGKPDGELKAGGALYFSSRPGESKADTLLSPEEAEECVREDIVRSGVLLHDERVLCAMDADLSGEFIPVKRKKEGFSSTSTATAEELAEMERLTYETVSRIGEELCRGGAQANPRILHGVNPCERCAMKPLCRRSSENTTHGEEET